MAKTGKGQRSTPAPPVKKSKYGNTKVTVDGITFDSKQEAARYGELQLQQMAGLITQLTVHAVLPIYYGTVLVCNYKCDFQYFRAGARVVEDVKGFSTDVYKLKKKLVKAVYGIDITEIRKRR